MTRNPHVHRTHPAARPNSAASYRPLTARAARPSPVIKRIPLKIKLLACALAVVFIGGHVAWTQHVSAEALANQRLAQQIAAQDAIKSAHFSQQVTALIATHPELRISVVAAPSEGSAVRVGALDSFDAASTAKLLTAVDYMHHVERGQAKLSTDINGETAAYWLKIMIINSDDTAWSALNTYLGHTDLQSYAKSLGITDYEADTNTMTASDITSLLRKLYDGKLLNGANRSLLLSYLAQANYREFAVAAVPRDMKVYHKIGIDDDSVHDALIITNGNHSVALTIFTDGHGTYNWDARKALMQAITRDAIAAYL